MESDFAFFAEDEEGRPVRTDWATFCAAISTGRKFGREKTERRFTFRVSKCVSLEIFDLRPNLQRRLELPAVNRSHLRRHSSNGCGGRSTRKLTAPK